MVWFGSFQEELRLQRISPQTCIIPKISLWKINVEEFKSFQSLEVLTVKYLWMRWPFEHYYWIVLKIYWALNKNKAHCERNVKWVPRRRGGAGCQHAGKRLRLGFARLPGQPLRQAWHNSLRSTSEKCEYFGDPKTLDNMGLIKTCILTTLS